MAKYWILVAESSRARIFSATRLRKPELTEMEDLVYPEGRLHEGDLTSDRPGTEKSPSGQGRHVLADETSAKKQGNIQFARLLADKLDAGRNRGDYEHLILVAPPAFLGLLRDSLKAEIGKRVVKQINKNLTHETTKQLQVHLANL